MAAAPASRPENVSAVSVGHACNDCGAALPAGDVVARFVCPSCGHPHAVSPAENYFEAFGVPERFAQDRAELESRFYASRARFIRTASRERRSQADGALARAHGVSEPGLSHAHRSRGASRLRPGARGLIRGKARQPPVELAEAWFEIQDSEDPDRARGVREGALASVSKKREADASRARNPRRRGLGRWPPGSARGASRESP